MTKIVSEIKKAKSIFITGHARPDGDTAGASLALYLALTSLGKKTEIYSKEPFPDYLKFLPSSRKIKIGSAVRQYSSKASGIPVLPMREDNHLNPPLIRGNTTPCAQFPSIKGEATPLPPFIKGEYNQSETGCVKNNPLPTFNKWEYDLAIILECSDLERAGNVIRPQQAKKIINIDHHVAHNNFGDINWIVPKASATCELVYLLLKKLEAATNRRLPIITKEIAVCLYTGFLTDTGKFQQKNTTPEAFKIAGKLREAGIDIVQINDHVYGDKSPGALKLLGIALSSLEISHSGRIASMVLTKEDFIESAASQSDTEDIINYPLSIKGVMVVAMFKEIENGFTKVTKVSMRSKGNIDLTEITKSFNGGGHKHAAGFTIKCGIPDAKKITLEFFANIC